MEILNRVAKYNYFIIEELECGIELMGTEVKSIRDGKCQIRDSYAIIKRGQMYLLNMFVAPYKEGNIFNHQETRTRKLLAHKKEILKLNEKVKLQGYTLIPLKVYLNQKNKVKVLIGICKGKNVVDKRETEKERSIKREIDKATKNH